MARYRPRSEKKKAKDKYRAAQKMLARERDGWCCRCCGKWLGNGGGGVHHVIYLSRGGSDELDNLILLCEFRPCMAHKRAHLLYEPYLYIKWDGEDFVMGTDKLL